MYNNRGAGGGSVPTILINEKRNGYDTYRILRLGPAGPA